MLGASGATTFLDTGNTVRLVGGDQSQHKFKPKEHEFGRGRPSYVVAAPLLAV